MLNFDINIEDMKLFYHVVERGGFLRAAEALNMAQGKVSRRVARLEEAFGVTLLYCDMRSVRLTPLGKIVFEASKTIVEVVTQAHLEIRHECLTISGDITLSSTTGFGNFWLVPVLDEFAKTFEDVTFELKNNDLGNANLMMGEADIMITSSKPDFRESLECHLLCEYPLHIYAAPSYLEKRGVPQCAQDLDQHSIIAWKEPLPDYILSRTDNDLLYTGRNPNDPRTPFVSVESDINLISSISHGLGLGFIAKFLADSHPSLQRIILSDQQPFEREKMHKKYIVYPKILNKSERHRTLIHFIKERARELNEDI